jgi:hypothetical protein
MKTPSSPPLCGSQTTGAGAGWASVSVEDPPDSSELVSPSSLVLAAGSDSAGSTAGVAVGTGPASLAPEPHPARSAEIMRRRGSALVMGHILRTPGNHDAAPT